MKKKRISGSRRVLIVMDAYIPGRLSGGPVTSIVNMIESIHDEIEFTVITRNSDLDGTVYSNVPLATPVSVGSASVIYLSNSDLNARAVLKWARNLQADTIYLNSFFSALTVRLLLRLRFSNLMYAVVLAPRGEFSLGALNLKAKKKRAYLKLFSWLGLGQVIDKFQGSSLLEKQDICRILGPVPVQVAADMPDLTVTTTALVVPAARRLVFIGRISPMKNLLYALELFREFPQPIEFDIYGPLEDSAYWEQCKQAIKTLPTHIRVVYRGVLEHNQVTSTFARYTAFLLPTLGENYGHVVIEALSGGCAVVLSDRTPWRDLEAYKVGWVCDLNAPEAFREAIRNVLDEPSDQAIARRERCVAYARRVATDTNVREDNLRLFKWQF